MSVAETADEPCTALLKKRIPVTPFTGILQLLSCTMVTLSSSMPKVIQTQFMAHYLFSIQVTFSSFPESAR